MLSDLSSLEMQYVPFLGLKPLVWDRLISGPQLPPPEVLPHVYSSSGIAQGNILSHLGSKYMLPMGTTRHAEEVRPILASM